MMKKLEMNAVATLEELVFLDFPMMSQKQNAVAH